MPVKTKPASRFGWPGTTLRYEFDVEDGAEVRVEPCPGLQAHMEEAEDGHRIVEIEVERRTGFA